LFSTRIAAAFVAFFILGSAVALADTTGTVRGTATVDGHPTAGVLVTLSGEGTDAKTTSDKGGAFAFARVTYGHYTITAHEDGYPDVTTTVDVASNSVATVNMAISKLKEIGHAQATSRGVGGSPVSVNTLGQQQIAVSPNNNSLNSLVQSVPGIVKFSYNEPVAHGFHGLTYEIDGAPLPQASTQDFSEVIDPKTIERQGKCRRNISIRREFYIDVTRQMRPRLFSRECGIVDQKLACLTVVTANQSKRFYMQRMAEPFYVTGRSHSEIGEPQLRAVCKSPRPCDIHGQLEWRKKPELRAVACESRQAEPADTQIPARQIAPVRETNICKNMCRLA